jgi:predicted RNA-binding Zn-ribbon protein involved in translation (DUF1610 family)
MILATATDHPHAGEAHDCFLCPHCGEPMISIREYVPGRGHVAAQQCTSLACLHSAPEAELIRLFGLCGRAKAAA